MGASSATTPTPARQQLMFFRQAADSGSSNPNMKQRLIDPLLSARRTRAFSVEWYKKSDSTWKTTSWLGVEVQKCPLDLWIYQEIITEVRPDLIVETGTLHGGSALYLANVCDLVGHGGVMSIDIAPQSNLPSHSRLRFLRGSSVDENILGEVRAAASRSSVLVILDSDHSKAHVLAELAAYSPLVTPGSYLIVEDTNVNGHPVFPEHGPGPLEALQEFLPHHPEFVVDRHRERLMLTLNPSGYLRRL